jgi:predicted ester cyclase
MSKPDPPPRYHVFVLRAWEERGALDGPAAWRFSVEAPSTGQRRGFATLEALMAYLGNLFSTTPSHRKEKGHMSLKELKAKIQHAGEEAWHTGRMDGLDEVYAADYVSHKPPFPDTVGLEAVKQSLAATRLAYSEIQVDYTECMAEGDSIAYRYTSRMKHTGTSPTLPIPPTGKVVILQGCVVVHVKDGKVVEEWEYSDYLGFLQQLGVVPAMG